MYYLKKTFFGGFLTFYALLAIQCVRSEAPGDEANNAQPKYKLTYFNAKGSAEPIRFMLKILGQEFEDIRFSSQDWNNNKHKMPFGKVPILTVDGVVLHQAEAITQYLGRQANMAGDNDWEDLQINMAVATILDFKRDIVKWQVSADKKKTPPLDRIEPLRKWIEPLYLEKFNKQVEENEGYFANGKLSWGDVYFIGISDYLIKLLGFNFFYKYPTLFALRNKVLDLPEISKWVKIRPETNF